MFLNYHAFPNRSGNFCFHADNDEQAKAYVLDFIKSSEDDARATIYKWSDVKKTWDFDGVKLEVEIKEPALPHGTEYKLEITYVKYVKVTGIMTEDEFYRDSKRAAKMLLAAPNLPGWVKMHEECNATPCADDDRYHVKEEEVETITIGQKA